MTFWVVCGLLVLTALAFVLPPLVRHEPRSTVRVRSLEDANAAVYRDQLANMRTDLRDGVMTAEEFVQAREELEQRLTADLSVDSGKWGDRSPIPSYWLALTLALTIPIAAVFLYMALGTPP